MDELLQKLSLWGCDTPSALNRLLDDKELLIHCINLVSADPAFDTLGQALREENSKAAFVAAHMLKGIIANTELAPLYKIIVQIVEPLRQGQTDGLLPLYEELLQKNQELKNILKG